MYSRATDYTLNPYSRSKQEIRRCATVLFMRLMCFSNIGNLWQQLYCKSLQGFDAFQIQAFMLRTFVTMN